VSQTITIRLTRELADWLAAASKSTGVAQGRIIREQLEKARGSERQAFLRWAGAVSGPPELSSRKGFSRS